MSEQDKEFPLGLKESAGNDKTPYSPRFVSSQSLETGVVLPKPSFAVPALPDDIVSLVVGHFALPSEPGITSSLRFSPLEGITASE